MLEGLNKKQEAQAQSLLPGSGSNGTRELVLPPFTLPLPLHVRGGSSCFHEFVKKYRRATHPWGTILVPSCVFSYINDFLGTGFLFYFKTSLGRMTFPLDSGNWILVHPSVKRSKYWWNKFHGVLISFLQFCYLEFRVLAVFRQL